MTQPPSSQRLVLSAREVEDVFAQLEIAQAILQGQMARLREASAELRNIAQTLVVKEN